MFILDWQLVCLLFDIQWTRSTSKIHILDQNSKIQLQWTTHNPEWNAPVVVVRFWLTTLLLLLFNPDIQEIIGFYWLFFRYINAAKSESLDELPDHQTRREAPSAGKVTSRDRVPHWSHILYRWRIRLQLLCCTICLEHRNHPSSVQAVLQVVCVWYHLSGNDDFQFIQSQQ